MCSRKEEKKTKCQFKMCFLCNALSYNKLDISLERELLLFAYLDDDNSSKFQWVAETKSGSITGVTKLLM